MNVSHEDFVSLIDELRRREQKHAEIYEQTRSGYHLGLQTAYRRFAELLEESGAMHENAYFDPDAAFDAANEHQRRRGL